MNVGARDPMPPGDEISALIETLHQTERRLEELTAGEVDSVTDREGRTFLLRRAQDQLRAGVLARQAAILNALPAHIAMIDADGTIISVNEAWHRFATDNLLQGPGAAIGVNYLDVCDCARGEDSSEARPVAEGIRKVLHGEIKSFSIEYPCHSPSEERWFLMTVTPLPDVPPSGAVVMHLNTTAERQAEAGARLSVEASLDAVVVADADGRITAWNVQAEKTFGWTARQAIGQLLTDTIIPPRFQHAHARGMRLFVDVGEDPILGKRVEMAALHRDGHEVPVELAISPIRLRGSWIFNASIRDLTVQKRNEASLQRFSAAMNATPDAIYLVDRATMRYIYVNDAACKLGKQTREELLELGPAGLLATSEIDLARAFDEIIATGKPAEPVEMLRSSADGAPAWIELRRHAQRFGNDWVIVSIARDITKRKQVAAELEESDRRFSDMMGNVDLIAIVVDERGNISYCNAYFLSLTGWTREELLGEEFIEKVIPPELADELQRVHTGMHEGVPAARHHENEIVTRSGERRLVRWNNTLLCSPEGSVIGTASIGEDITDRRRAEDALQVSEHQQKMLAEQLERERSRLLAAQQVAKIGSWETDLSTMSVIWSAETHRIFETDATTFRPTHEAFTSMIHPEDRAYVDQAFNQSLIDPAGYRILEHRLLLPNGRMKSVEERWTVFCDEAKKPKSVVGTCQDITERVAVATKLQSSLAEFRSLAESMPQIVWITRSDGWNVYLNQQWMDYTGLTLEESLGEGWIKPFHPEDQKRASVAWQEALAKSGAYAIECRLRRVDGAYRWWLIRGVPIRDSAGTTLKWFGTCTDIHDIKMAEHEITQTSLALRESERRFSDLLRNVELASVMLDREARITFCNDYLLRLTGWKYEEVIGQNWFELFIPAQSSADHESFSKLLKNHSGPWNRESRILTRAGEVRLMRWNNSLLQSATGGVIGSASIGEDITDQKRAEEEIRRLNADLENRVEARTAELQAVNQELEAFDYSVSHDLKAPIRHVDGFSTMLLEDYGDKLDVHGRSCVMRIQGAAKRMDQLVGDLLALSMISRGELHRTDVDLSTLARQVFALLRQAEADREIDFVVEPDIKVNADAGLLRIVLDNLLGNARKFTAKRADARIEFGCSLIEGTPTFFVRDNGAGFDAAYADKLFAPFQRLHAQSEFTGTGIGLATVRRIITRHSGEVWAEAAVDAGATIHFTLPQ